MNNFVRRWIAERPRTPLAEALVAAACVAMALVARSLLTPWLGDSVPYITIFPAITLAAVLGGARAGVLCLLGAAFLTNYLFVAPTERNALDRAGAAGLLVFLLSGGLILWVCELLARAVRDLAAANRQQRELVLELQHRVKNTLTIVQAIAAQTFRAGDDPAWFKAAFTERLIALSRAHDLLSRVGWGPVTLRAVVEGATGPFLGPGDQRLRVEGEAVTMSPQLVVDLSLCLHELATNATKYGALSEAEGRVEVSWDRRDGRLRLIWSEHDGPVMRKPDRQGYGTHLLKRGVGRAARPKVKLEHRPQGLRWSVEFDLD